MARGPLGPTNSLPARYPPISAHLLPRQKNDLEPDARIDGTRLAHRSSGAPTRQAGMENQPGPRIRQPCEPALTVASARKRKYSDRKMYFWRTTTPKIFKFIWSASLTAIFCRDEKLKKRTIFFWCSPHKIYFGDPPIFALLDFFNRALLL